MRVSLTRTERAQAFTLSGVSIGILLILAGLAVPSASLIQAIRVVPDTLSGELLEGGTLFKLGLVIIGLAMTVFVPAFRRHLPKQEQKSLLWSIGRPQLLLVAGLLLIATILRLYDLGTGLWHDEIAAYLSYVKLPAGEIVTFYDSENQHILYSLLAHVSLTAFGDNAGALRLPAALFGVASIGAVYLLGREVADFREAILSAAFLTFSYHHIWFSQNARGYTALLFFALLTSWLLLRALKQSSIAPWLSFALASALGVYAHLTMIFVVIGQGVVYLSWLWAQRDCVWPNRWAGLVWGFGLSGLLTFQLYALVLPQLLAGLKGTVSVVAEWKQPLWTLLELFNGLEISFAGGLVAGVALLVFGAGLLNYARTSPELVQLLIVPPVVGTVLVMVAGHHLWPRFYFFAFGFVALVAVRGTTIVARWIGAIVALSPAKVWLAGTVLAVAMILVSAKSVPYVYAPKQDYAGALAFVESSLGPGDAIVTVGLASYTYQNLYKRDWKEVKTPAELNAIRTHAARTWLIYTLAPQAESVYPEVMQSVRRDFRIVKQFYGSVGDGTIFVCLADAPPSTSLPIGIGMMRSYANH